MFSSVFGNLFESRKTKHNKSELVLYSSHITKKKFIEKITECNKETYDKLIITQHKLNEKGSSHFYDFIASALLPTTKGHMLYHLTPVYGKNLNSYTLKWKKKSDEMDDAFFQTLMGLLELLHSGFTHSDIHSKNLVLECSPPGLIFRHQYMIEFSNGNHQFKISFELASPYNVVIIDAEATPSYDNSISFNEYDNIGTIVNTLFNKNRMELFIMFKYLLTSNKLNCFIGNLEDLENSEVVDIIDFFQDTSIISKM